MNDNTESVPIDRPTPKTLIEIQSFDGIVIPLPLELREICCEETSNIYNLMVLHELTQKYSDTKNEEQNSYLRQIIHKLRDLCMLYPTIKVLLVDFVAEQLNNGISRSEFKEILLFAWIEKDEEMIMFNRAVENARLQKERDTILARTNSVIEDLMIGIENLFKSDSTKS